MPTEPRMILGDCLNVMRDMESGSVDAVVTDPPYPFVKRKYGYWTYTEWFSLMQGVVTECKRILKPKGSAVFILQPNSERISKMRPWLWDFMAWSCREWNQIQDVWWWNYTAIPEAHAIQGKLFRPSVKACVWLGDPDCYRNQDEILWSQADSTKAWRKGLQAIGDHKRPSGHHLNRKSVVSSLEKRDGVTPFNLLPVLGSDRWNGGGAYGHPASTPLLLCDKWVRYISPPGGMVCDPFMGSGTVGIAAIRLDRFFFGIEKYPPYFALAQSRLFAERSCTPLFD